MNRDIKYVVVNRRQIARRVGALARQIAAAYDRQELSLLAAMTGSLIFLADLIRRLPLRMRLNVVSISSYGSAMQSRGPRLLTPLPGDFAAKNVLIIDDILDSGQTLELLLKKVRAMNPASLRSCVLLEKNRPDLPHRVQADFVGFHIPDNFVVGYGLDYDSLYRNLPDICVLKPRCYGVPVQKTNPPSLTRRKTGAARPIRMGGSTS